MQVTMALLESGANPIIGNVSGVSTTERLFYYSAAFGGYLLLMGRLHASSMLLCLLAGGCYFILT